MSDSFKGLEESVAGFSKTILIAFVSLAAVWVSILTPTQVDFVEVVHLTEALSDRGRRIGAADDGASLYANDLRNYVLRRARRQVEECEDAAYARNEATSTESAFVDGAEDLDTLDQAQPRLQTPVADQLAADPGVQCGSWPGDSLWEFYRFATIEETRAFEAARARAQEPRALRRELLELATFEILGTRIVFPRMWGPPIWLIACFGVMFVLRRFVWRLHEASTVSHRFEDRELARLQDHWTIRVSTRKSEQRLEVSLLLGVSCLVMMFLIGHVAYQGFLIGGLHWTVRRAAGFIGNNSHLSLGAYLATVSVFSIGSISILLTTVHLGRPFRVGGGVEKPQDIDRRILLAAIPSALIVLMSRRFVTWGKELLPTLRLRPHRDRIRTEVKLPKGVYELEPVEPEKHNTLVYVDNTGWVQGRRFLDQTRLKEVNAPHLAEIVQFNAKYGGTFRSRAIEEAALDLFEEDEVSKCITLLENAIRFDLTTAGLAANRRISVRLMDLCALIVLRHRGKDEVEQFAKRVEKLWLQAREYRARGDHKEVENRRVRSRIQKWTGSVAPRSGTIRWLDVKGREKEVEWCCPRGPKRSDGRLVRI